MSISAKENRQGAGTSVLSACRRVFQIALVVNVGVLLAHSCTPMMFVVNCRASRQRRRAAVKSRRLTYRPARCMVAGHDDRAAPLQSNRVALPMAAAGVILDRHSPCSRSGQRRLDHDGAHRVGQ